MRKLTTDERAHLAAIKKLAKSLHKAGWKTLTFQYCASGDSLNESLFTIENEEDVFGLSELSASDLPPDFSANDTMNHFIGLLPAGFEDGDGSSGEIQLDTGSGKVTVQHSEYYTESKDSEWIL